MSPAARRLATGVAGAAVLVAGVTVLARVVGFGRWLVFADTVGATCLGTAYSTANMLPNIIFEVVVGGALAGAVVPLIAVPLSRGDTEVVRRTASALLSWVLVLLVPVSLLAALAAGPLMAWLVGDPARCDAADVQAVATGMFVVFAPQIALYGVAVVAGGVLNAHRRFLAAALAPLLSSLVVVGAYVWFGVGYEGSRNQLDAVPTSWLAVLAVGTTLGVLTLALSTAVPMSRLRLGLRPTLRFPAGVAPRARALAAAGVGALVAHQVWLLVVVLVTADVGGAINVFNFAWAVYLLPYAVLAVPVATSAFTALSERAGRDDLAGVATTTSATTRAVLLTTLLGAAVLVGTADPVARTFIAPGEAPGPEPLAAALVAFAPGLVGYGLLALHGRVLYAMHLGRAAALGPVIAWALAVVGALVTVPRLPDRLVVAGIGGWASLGCTVAALVVAVVVARRLGRPALEGSGRALLTGLAGAVLAVVAARAVAGLLDPSTKVGAGLLAVGAAAAGAIVFGAVVALVDRRDLGALTRRRSGART